MFHFGNPNTTVATILDGAIRTEGPGLQDPEVHYTEMSLQELKTYFAYLRMVCEYASQTGQPEDVLEAAVKAYDEVFLYLIDMDDDFSRRVCHKHHVRLFNDMKYRYLAGCDDSAN